MPEDNKSGEVEVKISRRKFLNTVTPLIPKTELNLGLNVSGIDAPKISKEGLFHTDVEIGLFKKAASNLKGKEGAVEDYEIIVSDEKDKRGNTRVIVKKIGGKGKDLVDFWNEVSKLEEEEKEKSKVNNPQ